MQLDCLPRGFDLPDAPEDLAESEEWMLNVADRVTEIAPKLWPSVLSALRKSFERLPRTWAVSMFHEFGDLSDGNVLLKTVNSLVRAIEPEYGITMASRVIGYSEVCVTT